VALNACNRFLPGNVIFKAAISATTAANLHIVDGIVFKYMYIVYYHFEKLQ